MSEHIHLRIVRYNAVKRIVVVFVVYLTMRFQ
jgi:hypothetical protein